MANERLVSVTVIHPKGHTHKGVHRLPGASIDVPERKIPWLVDHGVIAPRAKRIYRRTRRRTPVIDSSTISETE